MGNYKFTSTRHSSGRPKFGVTCKHSNSVTNPRIHCQRVGNAFVCDIHDNRIQISFSHLRPKYLDHAFSLANSFARLTAARRSTSSMVIAGLGSSNASCTFARNHASYAASCTGVNGTAPSLAVRVSRTLTASETVIPTASRTTEARSLISESIRVCTSALEAIILPSQ